ncbi:MAG: SDR family oxidoreductase [Planctomycetota bacterium]
MPRRCRRDPLRSGGSGGAGFALKTGRGTRIYLDPYLSDAVEQAFGFKRLSLAPVDAEDVRADWAVASHEHLDHQDLDALAAIARRNPGCRFAGPRSCAEGWERIGIDPSRRALLEPGSALDLGGVRVHAARAYHGDLSEAALVALRLQIAFVAAKAAVIRMTEAMACELGPRGIRVNAVSPGSILTEGTRELFYADPEKSRRILSFIPQARPGETAEIAEAIAWLASDASSYVNGHNLVVDGGWTCGFNRDF